MQGSEERWEGLGRVRGVTTFGVRDSWERSRKASQRPELEI